MEIEHNSFLKPRTCLAALGMVWGPGLGGAAASDSEKSTLPTLGAMVIGPTSPKASMYRVSGVLKKLCVPFVQHCLI